ncbi:MAG: SDR family NAD(P)-dependent oxidoreductase [Minisyncoccia bacterium]|jgi:benzil reductase ((S)-benzoin forming)
MNKKTVIITGVSSGLGKALFDTLRGTGVRLICISRTFLSYQTALSDKNVTLLVCDLSNVKEVFSITQKLNKILEGANDIVFINNAATIAPIGLIGEIDDGAIVAAANINFVSPMLIMNVLCKLQKAKKLTFIHLTTGAARTPIIGWPLYCSTKAALKMFFAIIKRQYKNNKRFIVHEFDPGVMNTPMQKQIRQSSRKNFPRVEEFKKLQRARKLSNPLFVAQKLVKRYIRV